MSRALAALFLTLLTTTAWAQIPGRLDFEPSSASVGATVQATVSGLAPGQEVVLVWNSADAWWNVDGYRFLGVLANETRAEWGRGVVDEAGQLQLDLVVPEDYGYLHDVFVEDVSGERLARQGFMVVPELSISPTSGPPGTPITVTLTGVGYRFWEMVWHLMVDGAHTGWLSAITTRGTSVAVIPAPAEVGLHNLMVMTGVKPIPYLNQQQAPIYKPQIPTVMSLLFETTDGPPVLPPPVETQVLPRDMGYPPAAEGPSHGLSHLSGVLGDPLSVRGRGFPAGAIVEMAWTTTIGNRVTGAGWETAELPLGTVTVGADGSFSYLMDTPDDLGGAHDIIARSGDIELRAVYTINPSVIDVFPKVVEPGGDVILTIKGVGWTETANIYTMLLDNGYIGYGCGFNSQGDVTIHFKAPGREGIHYIQLYPAIYRGEMNGPGAPDQGNSTSSEYIELPMLNHVDHPGERLNAFTLAFEVRRAD